MEKLFVLTRGEYYDGTEKSGFSATERAFRSKEDMIKYVMDYVHNHIDALSKSGYVRIPTDDEFVMGEKIRYARDNMGYVRYFKYDTCEL